MSRTMTFEHGSRIVLPSLSALLIVSFGFVCPAMASAQSLPTLPPLGDVVNAIIPPLNPGPLPGSIPPIVQAPASEQGQDTITDAAYAALLPSPVGDPFFDQWPADLSTMKNGQIIGIPDDVTNVAGIFFPALGGVSVHQLKFKTTDSEGADSFGTASLIIPDSPWTGGGSRPLLVDEKPIDALGTTCTPSYTLRNGLNSSTSQTDFAPPTAQAATLRNYAVLIPDHEGPRMSYAEPVVAGRITLDAIRAVQQYDSTYVDSAMVVNGYSGGAIATRGTALEVGSYAPELVRNIRLAVMGGNPIDYEALSWSMDGPRDVASGVFHGATVGYLRSHRQGFLQANNLAMQIAASPYKDLCITGAALIGAFIPTRLLSNDGDPMNSVFAQEVFREQRDNFSRPSAVPLYIFNGAQEFWIPSEPARNFAKIQCGQGVSVTYTEPFGEHVIAGVTGIPGQYAAIDRAMQGAAQAGNCGTY